MAGRPLRRARAAALENLDPEDARRIAQPLLRRLSDTQLLVYLMAARRKGTAPPTMDDVRGAARQAILGDPELAAMVISQYPAVIDRELLGR